MSRILIIEDEEAIADLEKDYLELSGFSVEIAADGIEGEKKALSDEFDLIVLDLMLPGKDGFEVCRSLREKKNTPIIMVSAKKDDIDKIRGLGMGADDYIIKPFEFERFNLALCNYQRRHHLVEEQQVFEQNDLDSTIIRQEKGNLAVLPKGLDKHTLAVVWEKICSFDGMFTTEEVAALVGLSRVSIRKYLEFLKAINLLKLDLHRGSVGRPVYKYLCLDKKSDVLNVYMH